MQTIKLADTYDESTLINGKIAPGTKGSFDLTIDATGAEVGVKYVVDFQNETNKPTNLKFSYKGQVLDEIEEYEQYFTGIINADDTNKVRVLTVEWEWAYESKNNGKNIIENDKQDTQEGKNLESYKFKINVRGEEKVK